MATEWLEKVEEKMEEILEEIKESQASSGEEMEEFFQSQEMVQGLVDKKIEKISDRHLEFSAFKFEEEQANKVRKTLEQIRKDTQNFTLIEKKKGFLTKKYPIGLGNIDERLINSDVICRFRYVMREYTQKWLDYYLLFDNKFENKIIAELNYKLNEIYNELGICGEHERFVIDVKKINENHTQVTVLLSVGVSCDFVKFDLDFLNTKALLEG